MARTVLIGLDGASYTNLQPLMDDGVMPFLKQFISEGVKADLMSTACPVTPPAWTSILTGRNPGQHGIFDFIHVDPNAKQGNLSFRLTNGRDIQCESIMEVASRSEMTSAVMNFPNSFQLRPFDGYMIPGFVTSRLLRTSVQPRSIWPELQSLPEFNVKDVSWDLDEGRKPLSTGLDQGAFREWVDYLIRKDAGWFAIARYLMQEKKCDLVAVVIECVDRLQHLAWHVLDPDFIPAEMTPSEQNERTCSIQYFSRLDDQIKRLVTAAGPSANVFIVSDHGFGPTTEIFYANALLEQLGHFVWRKHDTDDAGEDVETLTADNMRDHFQAIDWERSVAYARTTSANGIYIRVASEPGAPGIAPEEYEAFRDKLRGQLLNWIDPATGTPVVVDAVTREEAFSGPATDLAPDLTLTLRDGGFLSIMPSDEILKQRASVKGTHRPNGIFIARGPHIQKGLTIDAKSLLDIAPTLFYSMGVPIPEDFEGFVITDAFEPEALETNPMEFGEATQPLTESTEKSERLSEADEDVILERLKALGYVE